MLPKKLPCSLGQCLSNSHGRPGEGGTMATLSKRHTPQNTGAYPRCWRHLRPSPSILGSTPSSAGCTKPKLWFVCQLVLVTSSCCWFAGVLRMKRPKICAHISLEPTQIRAHRESEAIGRHPANLARPLPTSIKERCAGHPHA